MKQQTTEQFHDRLPVAGRDQHTGFLLQRAHQWARRVFNEALGELHIETRHLGVLTALAEHETLHQKQLVDQLELDKSSVVLIVDDLERLGFAQRGADPHDRRAHAVQITGEGRKRLAAARQIAERLGRRIFAGLSDNERKQLDRALLQIIRNCKD